MNLNISAESSLVREAINISMSRKNVNSFTLGVGGSEALQLSWETLILSVGDTGYTVSTREHKQEVPV